MKPRPPIALRPLRAGDGGLLEAMIARNRIGLTRWLGWPDGPERWPGSEALLRECLEDRANGSGAHYLIYAGAVAVGYIGLYDMDAHGGFAGFWIDQAHHGLGIATEALHQLEALIEQDFHLPTLALACHADNHASQAVAAHGGYQQQGKFTHPGSEGAQANTVFLYVKILNT
jgi:RimJ/RimL family protein N-acetyltransferase